MTQKRGCNRLGSEASPYLLQHAANPVDWYSWGAEAFEQAKVQDKPIFLSIGYSTCYWCHVMEQDSFETQAVADVLKRDFISIKVDREERPDVDQLYMDTVVGLTGGGGWPLSVFLTWDLKPFWGGTFYYRDAFIELLQEIAKLWREQRGQVQRSAAGIEAALKARSWAGGGQSLSVAIFAQMLEQCRELFDAKWGGFGAAPKFPPSGQIEVLLRLAGDNEATPAKQMALLTLNAMARGGIYDQVGGGFHRYAMDAGWQLPHFEKMLYDNALLAGTYLSGYLLCGDEFLAQIARETLDYVLRDLGSPEGAFYAAQDAGVVGQEGGYYLWTLAELKHLLNKAELERFCRAFGVSERGNHEAGLNVLALQAAEDVSVRSEGLIVSALNKLRKAREQRPAPHRDDKILCGWNGLMLSALARAAQTLDDERYYQAAVRAATFLKTRHFVKGELFRTTPSGSQRIAATLEDYAYLIQGLLDLYQVDFNLQWYLWAQRLQKIQNALLWDEGGGGYFFSRAPELLVHKKDCADGALPAGNAVAAMNLQRLGLLSGSVEYQEQARRILQLTSERVTEYLFGHAALLQAWHWELYQPISAVVLLGDNPELGEQFFRRVNQCYLPDKVLVMDAPVAGAAEPGILTGKTLQQNMTTFYICRDGSCREPTTDIERALELVTGQTL